MKFAHELKEALRHEGFPPHWVESVIPYGLLKKSIKKVEAELRSFGLDAVTLRRLGPPSYGPDNQSVCSANRDAAVVFRYHFGDNPTAFRPTLIIYIQLDDAMAIDASLSPDTLNFLASLVEKQRQLVRLSSSPADHFERRFSKDISALQTPGLSNGATPSSSMDRGVPRIKQIEVPLTFDAEFFEILEDDVTTLDTLRAAEQKSMSRQTAALGKEIAKVTNPSKYRKSDLETWRQIFNIYLQAGIFFSTTELDHGSRDSTVALKQLQWFQAEVLKRDIITSIKVPASRQAFDMFTTLNLTLLRNMKFQEINQLAITKILKSRYSLYLNGTLLTFYPEFDKRTSLGAMDSFSTWIQSYRIQSETMAKAICFEVSKEVVKIVPQLDDYLCPVCFSISYKPIRLTCGHVFCIRCIIRLQRTLNKFCPLCRDEVVMYADSENIDISLMRLLQRYFPRETKLKQKENEIAAGVDFYGERYTDAKCIIM